MNTSTHIIYMPIAYRYMLTVHLIKMFQNKRTRNSYTIYLFKLKDNIFRIIITIEAKKLHSRYFRLVTIRFATHLNAHTYNMQVHVGTR